MTGISQKTNPVPFLKHTHNRSYSPSKSHFVMSRLRRLSIWSEYYHRGVLITADARKGFVPELQGLVGLIAVVLRSPVNQKGFVTSFFLKVPCSSLSVCSLEDVVCWHNDSKHVENARLALCQHYITEAAKKKKLLLSDWSKLIVIVLLLSMSSTHDVFFFTLMAVR